ncbi:hypothetical protein PLEOSDRAFT_1108975 [Pleurotus ostreatus PC15]|uniref:Uncharacterized protein n=1 Tax=Pleurotus ostreatus (strain PC15) TaxID=1137138 RepID=A0A067NHX7_PLEO1|nr:hypothetical protein PLEOSDRAFT_1108975 [Pleurotus ostreatus PC15]
MAVLSQRRSGRGRGAGSPAARAQSAQDAGTAQTATRGKKRGCRPRKKPASNATTSVYGAAKRKAKAGGARGPSQVTKNRSKHSKQPLGIGAAYSHSSSPAAVKSKAKNSVRDAITSSNGARTSASSLISHPKAPTLTPATPRPQPLSPISSMKAKPPNSKQQRKPLPPSVPLKAASKTNSTIATRSISQSRRNSKGEKPLRRTTPSLSHARADAQSSQPSSPLHVQYTVPKHNILPGRNPNSRGSIVPYVRCSINEKNALPKVTKIKSGRNNTTPVNTQASTSFPPSRPPGRPPIISGRDHTAGPLNDWRFRTNDFVAEQKFSEDEEAAFRRRLAECHAFNMTQLHISVREPSINKRKRKRKAQGCGVTKGTASKGKGNGKGKK